MAELRKIGNFELLERIGQGGMGTVFKARQISMDRIVAVKVLPPSMAKQQQFTERFQREARASARLNHPNVVNGIDVGKDEATGLYYFAMEYVEGPDIKQMLQQQGKFPERKAAKIGQAIAEALAHAHAHGILHRDIKPDNIIIEKNGTPKLCDLGLARLEAEGEAANKTQQGFVVGSPHYISPEQARGDRDLDPKTDLYSLGATLYHMLLGKTMFEGATSVIVMTKHVTDKAPHPNEAGPKLSKGMVQVLAKLLTKDRADRYASADLLAKDLDRVARGKPPVNADLPHSKSPFVVEAAPLTPLAPAKKPAGAASPEKGADSRSTTHGQHRIGGKLWPWYAAGAGAVLVLVFVGLHFGLGGKRLQEITARRTGDAAPGPGKAPPSGAATVSAAQTAHLPGPGDVKSLTPRPALPAGANGSKKTEEPVVAAPPAKATPATPPQDPAAAKSTPAPDTKTKPGAPEAPPGPAPDAEVASKVTPGSELLNLMSNALGRAAERKFAEAAQMFRLPDDKLDKLDRFDRGLCKLHAEGYQGLADMKTQVLERLKADPNKFDAKAIVAKLPEGAKLAGGDDKALLVSTGQIQTPYPWVKLSLEDLHALSSLVLGAPPPDTSVGLAVVSYGLNTPRDDDFIRKVLTGVNAPAAQRLLELIDLRSKLVLAKKQAVQNAYAEKLFYELDQALAQGKYDGMPGKGEQLQKKYADADLMKTRGAELETMIQLAKLAIKYGATKLPGNVALARNGATATGSPTAALLIDGNSTEYTGGTGFATVEVGGELVVALPKVCVLREIRLLLWDLEPARYYQYQVLVAHDDATYVMLADHSKGEWRSWQVLPVSPARPVKNIKFKGLYNSSESGVHVVELEAYCTPPDQPPVSRPESRPAPKGPRPPPKDAPPPPPPDKKQN
ncbi:MAG: serine/threonine-protein kinase [Planctomycetota bacterium]